MGSEGEGEGEGEGGKGKEGEGEADAGGPDTSQVEMCKHEHKNLPNRVRWCGHDDYEGIPPMQRGDLRTEDWGGV